MRLHKRTLKVNKAEAELGMLLLDWEKKYELTLAEIIQMLANKIHNCAKYQIRYERHGDCDKKGDEA